MLIILRFRRNRCFAAVRLHPIMTLQFEIPRYLPLIAILAGFLLLSTGDASGQQGEVASVEITAPIGTVQEPFRTSFSQLAIGFNHDGGTAGGFIAQSLGADVNSSNVLVNEASGEVGAFFSTTGLKTLSVRVTRLPTGSSAVSAPTIVFFDNQAPRLVISQIRRDPRLSFEPFVPGKVYFTSADAIDLRGSVNDGPQGTPAQDIQLSAGAVGGQQTSASADETGQFEVSIPLTGLPDGPGRLCVTASDRMSDGSAPNVTTFSDVRIGE